MPIPLAGAMLGAAGVSALGSVLGGILGSSAQESANSTNLQAVRETNEQNKQLFERQLGFTEEMWNKSNAYNTPSAQRARYEQAGINPFMAMSNIQSGNAQAATTPAATPMQAGQVQPVDAMANALPGIASSVGSGLVAYQDARMKENQIESVGIDNQIRAIDLRYKVQEKILELSERRASIAESNASADFKRKQLDELDEQIESLKTQNDYLGDYLAARNDRERNESDLAYWNSVKARLEGEYQKAVNDVFPELSEAQIKSLQASASASIASAVNSYSAANLNNQYAVTEDLIRKPKINEQVAKAASEWAKKNNINASTDQIKQLTPALVTKAVNDAAETKIGPLSFRNTRGLYSRVLGRNGKKVDPVITPFYKYVH